MSIFAMCYSKYIACCFYYTHTCTFAGWGGGGSLRIPASLISAQSRLGTNTRHNTDALCSKRHVRGTSWFSYSSVALRNFTQAAKMSRVKLLSSDGVVYTVDGDIIKKSMKFVQILFDDLVDLDPDELIPIPIIEDKILKKLIDWVIYHKGEPPFYKEVSDIHEFDKKFLEVDDETLSAIVQAADWLQMDDLLQLCYVHSLRDK
ncbi:hypothetical protein TSAR_000519 [Trichomalopsis sarcophagae]|uniref:SKP1 component POZ domain-containing protein n=1 Tax=Trichomalopsis sarcophagae TaxID=543379 RepID=A0A232F2N5_9HYME|nr:hypothetical protein TSAR_000519 [Trichomalopsis sarcophagae]